MNLAKQDVTRTEQQNGPPVMIRSLICVLRSFSLNRAVCNPYAHLGHFLCHSIRVNRGMYNFVVS